MRIVNLTKEQNLSPAGAVIVLVVALFLAACAAPGPEMRPTNEVAANAPYNTAATETRFATPPNERRGLGTEWGETRKSTSGTTTFVRATPNEPLAAAEIFYNDRAGIEAMVTSAEFSRRWPIIHCPAASLISIGLRDESGNFFPA